MKRSNKIVFDEDDDDGEPTASVSVQSTKALTQAKIKEKISGKKPTLFDEDEDSDDEKGFQGNFEIKQQFEGKKGEKLRRLQDRFQGDSRFKMDSKFLEDGSDDSETEGGAKQKQGKPVTKSSDDIETNETDEREWQLNILEKVMGKKVSSNAARDTQKK